MHREPACERRFARGFTLVEALTCATLAAVLLGLAVPSYRGSVFKSRRQEARIALLRLQSLQERHYFDHSRYAATLDALGAPTRSESGLYALALQASADEQHYALIATPTGAQAGDGDCRRLLLDERGRRSAEGGAEANERCWR